MTPDEERWAEALAIERWKGEGAAAFIDERIETLGRAGDLAGVERFMQIRRRFEALCDRESGRPEPMSNWLVIASWLAALATVAAIAWIIR